MKVWQLSAVLSCGEITIFEKYCSGVDTIELGRTEVDQHIVRAALGESKLQYHVTSQHYLRLMPEPEFLKEIGIETVEILSVLEAYEKFGGDAITEVVDYGSFNLRR